MMRASGLSAAFSRTCAWLTMLKHVDVTRDPDFGSPTWEHPMPDPGDMRAEPTSHTFDSNDRRGRMPPKTKGKHRWIVIATYATTREALMASARGEKAHLDQENLAGLQAGCLDCEEPWPSPEPCNAPEYPWG